MLEIIAAIAAIVVIVKLASNDGLSPWLWGGIMLLLAFASIVLIPLPYLRILIAGIVTFCAMIGYKVAYNK